MRILSILLSVLFTASGCSHIAARALAEEDADIQKEVLWRDSRLSADGARAVRYLEDQLRDLETSVDEDAPKAVANIRGRLSESREELAEWNEFIGLLKPGDRVFDVRRRRENVRYLVAVRGGQIVARTKPKNMDGILE